ncbi:FadR/GntR family transcriptional regulator [Pseudotabrizicola sp. L79]|uniref:FadR/GntR family transcriptional regulator n=1 Tax=Pseudotabrizicola sp. L79 TaxID=3118402 RepID=UPI002F940357
MTDTPHIKSPAKSGTELIDEALRNYLKEPGCKPGSKLPTERALSEQFKVARSAVRSALARLEAQGDVVRVMGSGTYVADRQAAQPESDRDPGWRDASPLEIMDSRLMVEPQLANLIVAYANGGDIDRIRQAMLGGQAATDFAEFEIWDGKFHQALADATQNPVIIEVYRTITRSRELAQWGELKKRSITEQRRAKYNIEHAEIVAALQARDAPRAEAAIRAHLMTVRENMLGSYMSRHSTVSQS